MNTSCATLFVPLIKKGGKDMDITKYLKIKHKNLNSLNKAQLITLIKSYLEENKLILKYS